MNQNSQEANTCLYGQLIYDKNARTYNVEKCWEITLQ